MHGPLAAGPMKPTARSGHEQNAECKRTPSGASLIEWHVTESGCGPTPPAPLGPFYRRNAPFRSRIVGPKEPGMPLIVSGRVLGAPDCSPISDAVLDVWQTNRRGLYSRILGFGGFFLRGRLRTSQDGILLSLTTAIKPTSSSRFTTLGTSFMGINEAATAIGLRL